MPRRTDQTSLRSARTKPLKVVFLGGGSFRILPIIRSVFLHKKIFRGGEIRLVDLNVPRAEAVGRMIMRTPESAGIECKVSWSANLDRALEGADVLYLTMAVGSPANSLAAQASMKRGFIPSDQLSVTGAFRSLMAGPLVLDFARKMEARCPDAIMLIFCNPVAVYSGMVNNHTKIRALGICGGAKNHRWDLTRLMGRDEYCDEYEVDVAGVNHLSFILNGTYRGEDLYEVLGRHLTKGWKPPRLSKTWGPKWRSNMLFGLKRLVYMYHRFGKIIFSNEFDGMMYLFYDEMFRRAARGSEPTTRTRIRPLTKARIRAAAGRSAKARRRTESQFRQYLKMDLDDAFWSAPIEENPWFGRDDHDITIPILKALAGLGRARIVASGVNRGTVAGFKDRTVLEYPQLLDRRGPRPAGKYEIPDCFQPLISSLATHQTLLGDATATQDPRILADALFTYPIKQNSRDSRLLFKELLKIHENDIPPCFQKARDYFSSSPMSLPRKKTPEQA